MAEGHYSEFTEYAVDSAVEGGDDDSESDENGWDDISTEV